MSNNFIRVLRNTDLCATREAAITKLEGKLATLQDGEICLASYGANWDAAKTILGVVRTKTVGSDTKRSYTIFDNEANSAEILAKIQELDTTVTSTGDSYVTVKVVQEDGLLKTLEVKTSDIASAALLGTKDDKKEADTAFGRIAKEVEERTTAITKAIADLHSEVKPSNNHSVLTGLTQANGVLTAKTEIQLANVATSGSAADVANAAIGGDTTHVAVAGENVSAQITDIAKTLKGVKDSIDEAKANDLKYITVKLSDTETSELGANVKEAYQVFAYTGTWDNNTNKGTAVGVPIKIYKDANVKEIYLGSSQDKISSDGTITKVPEKDIVEAELSLNYVYIMADGTLGMAKIPVGSFLRESEFKDGLYVSGNGEVSVKVDSTSETFLTVGQSGVKLSGVQNAIDNTLGTKIADLHADITGTSKDGEVSVRVTEAEGKITGVTVSTSGLALDSAVVKNVTVNNVDATVSGNKATVTIDGADIAVADTYMPTVYSEPFETKVGTANHIAANDKISEALKKTENTISVLATEVISNEKVTTAAITKLAESAGVVGADSVIGYQKKTDANYISAATSVHDATVKLDAAIKTVADNINALEGNALTSVVGGNGIEVSTKASNSQTVSLKLDTTKDGDGTTPTPGANALAVNANGLYLSNVWDCGEY